jgi:succinoglycan biosynthesis protein ExoL
MSLTTSPPTAAPLKKPPAWLFPNPAARVVKVGMNIPSGASLRVAYFVHDLSDAAVLRRVRMLRRAGAEVVVLGFRRTPTAPTDIDGAPAIDLGRTFDGRLSRRALDVARQVLAAPRFAGVLRGRDVVMARSLEMLVVAAAARRLHQRRARLVYECLDIHRLMVSPGLAGKALRGMERAALRQCQLLILSSPAFQRVYFEPFQGLGQALRLPVLYVENKILDFTSPGGDAAPAALARPAGPPWRVGWFGMLRCRKSFEILQRLAKSFPGVLEVVISGRPSDKEFCDFAGEAARSPGVTYTGAYAAEDLEPMYRSVHFAWAIDYFEEGANSEWLLPNRIYESGRYGAVPIALKSVETGRWLAEHGLGLLVQDPVTDLGPLLMELDAARYHALETRSRDVPADWFTAGERDCHELVEALRGHAA